MKQKIITGLLLFAILFPALYVGGWPLRAVVIGFLTISAYEVVIATGTKLPVWLVVPILAMVFVLGAIDEAYLLPVIITVIISLFIILVLLEELTLNDMTYLFIMVLMMAFTLRSVAAIQDYGTRLVVYIASITYATDTCAYFAGHAFGKHKLNPRISPKKTIEGSIGGWAGGFLIGMLFGYIFIRNIPFDLILISSFVLPLIGQFGDLAFSAVKRHYGIKDFGSIFPAHGGVLDRIDSLIFNLMTFFVLMNFFI